MIASCERIGFDKGVRDGWIEPGGSGISAIKMLIQFPDPSFGVEQHRSQGPAVYNVDSIWPTAPPSSKPEIYFAIYVGGSFSKLAAARDQY